MWNRFDDILAGWERRIASFCLVATTILAFIQVMNRYLLHFEVMGIGDLYLYLYIVCLYASLALTTKENGHTAVEVFGGFLERKAPKTVRRYKIAVQVTSLCILLLFLPTVWNFFRQSVAYPEPSTLVPWFNTSWLVYCMCLSLFLCAYHMIRSLFLALCADVPRTPRS